MKAGDLLFVKPYDFIGHGITFMTREGYSHVAMAVSPTLIFDAQYGSVSKVTGLYYLPNYEVVEMNLTDEQRQKLVNFIYESDVLGRIYDTKEILGWFFQLSISKIFKNTDIMKYFDDPKKFICIDAILYCYKEALGINLVNKPDYQVLFNDLYNNKYRLSQ